MTKIISVVNQKGGVGKTTTTINLATALAALKKKVLIIDLDPQGNATTGLGIFLESQDKTVYEVLIGGAGANDVIRETMIKGLHIIPANMELSGAEVELSSQEHREQFLKRAIESLEDKYQYILIDCPPSLSILTVNSLVASDEIIIPLQCEYFALEGLSHLVKTVESIKNFYNEKLTIKGILLTMYDSRNNLSKSVEKDVRDYYGGLVYTSIIPRNVKISEAPSHGYPVILHDPSSVGAKAYMDTAVELIKQERKANDKK